MEAETVEGPIPMKAKVKVGPPKPKPPPPPPPPPPEPPWWELLWHALWKSLGFHGLAWFTGIMVLLCSFFKPGDPALTGKDFYYSLPRGLRGALDTCTPAAGSVVLIGQARDQYHCQVRRTGWDVDEKETFDVTLTSGYPPGTFERSYEEKALGESVGSCALPPSIEYQRQLPDAALAVVYTRACDNSDDKKLFLAYFVPRTGTTILVSLSHSVGTSGAPHRDDGMWFIRELLEE
jgi:hypothetical protein